MPITVTDPVVYRVQIRTDGGDLRDVTTRQRVDEGACVALYGPARLAGRDRLPAAGNHEFRVVSGCR